MQWGGAPNSTRIEEPAAMGEYPQRLADTTGVLRGMSKRIFIAAAGALLAVLIATSAFAAGEGKSIFGGKRNPSSNQSQAYTSETEIIANTPTYGTRQSNKSDNGGGAIYGCRSAAGGTAAKNEPCIRSNNLSTGLAFEFASAGLVGGTINVTKGGDAAKPFTTNATGIATGLNADRVDSKSAADIVSDAVAAVVAANPYAQVRADGTNGASRGVVASNGITRQGVGDYNVIVDGDRSTCAVATSLVGTSAGQITADPTLATDKKTTTIDVRTFDAAGAAADRAFHLSFTC
jgi:hypothetical protein